MGAPKGNQFWKIRSRHGRDMLFKTPKLLWEAACEYFEWCDENPWLREELKVVDKAIERESVSLGRPYTLVGLCLYIHCSEEYFRKFKSEERAGGKDFIPVINQIEQTIYSQKFEGASVGVFNANIISRELGLVDRSESKNETTITNITPSPEEVKKIRKAMEKKI